MPVRSVSSLAEFHVRCWVFSSADQPFGRGAKKNSFDVSGLADGGIAKASVSSAITFSSSQI